MTNHKNAETTNIFIALGSNLGSREKNLAAAIALLPPSVLVLRESPIYQTAPWGYEEQPAFLNQVVLASTKLSPKDLLIHLKNVENMVGRRPTFLYGPREVDLDILFYGDLILKTSDLEIPHPKVSERAFVLVPLNDLAPTFCHPITGTTISTLLASLDTTGVNLYRS